MDGELLKKKDDAPNVIWTGKGEPPSAVNVGNVYIGELPDAAAQRKGFHVEPEHVALLCSTFNGYKTFHGRGE